MVRKNSFRLNWMGKLIILYVLVMGILLMIQIHYIIPYIRNRELETKKVYQEEIADNLSRELEDDLARIEGRLLKMITQPEFLNNDIEKQTKTITWLKDVSNAFSDIFIMDSEGYYIAGTAGDDLSKYQTISYSDQLFFSIPFVQGKTCCGYPEYRSSAGHIICSLNIPIQSDTGERTGVLSSLVILNDLVSRVKDYELTEGTIITLVDTEGTVIASSNIDLFSLEDGPLSLNYSKHHPCVQNVMEGKGGAYEHAYNGIPYFSCSSILESNGWGVIVETPMDIMMAEINTMSKILWMINIILFIFALFFLIVFSRQIDRDREKAEENLKHLSLYDSLTGLYNRYYFEEELKRLDTARQIPISIAMGDLNSLKLVNDTFGHEKGDMLLKRIAGLIKDSFRSEDIVARWGGDEFSVILPRTSKITTEEIISRIREKCRNTNKDEIPLSISIGVATKESPDQDIHTVIGEAEDNMYRNKLLEKDSITHSLISSLETSLFEKSHETREHTDNLNELVLKLGRKLKLSESGLDELSLLSRLHNIGKVAIPEKILQKKGKLTMRDWDTIKKHPVIGSNICSSSPLLSHIANAVLCHHEWWDGSGYPKGLKGNKIPMISRVIAIVDAYDAMIHERSYKKKMTIEEAVQELKVCAGTQFDPGLVETFIDIIENK